MCGLAGNAPALLSAGERHPCRVNRVTHTIVSLFTRLRDATTSSRNAMMDSRLPSRHGKSIGGPELATHVAYSHAEADVRAVARGAHLGAFLRTILGVRRLDVLSRSSTGDLRAPAVRQVICFHGFGDLACAARDAASAPRQVRPGRGLRFHAPFDCVALND
jgi:hypothetical protein